MDKATLLERLKLYGKRTLIVLGVFLGVAALFALMGAAVFAALNWQAGRDTPGNRRSAIASAQAWGQLAPLPVKDAAVAYQAGGSPLARRYQLSFEAEPADIQLWVQRSPGLAGLKRPLGAKGVSSVLAHGEGGHGNCKVSWSQGGRQVSITASWD